MKKLCIKLLAIVFFATSLASISVAQDLPRPSPGAKVEQTVGLTDVSVEYSSPGVKDRKIWGELVPYDKIWRTGANMCTKITLSKDAKINGNDLPAGEYSIFTIPGEAEWTVIFNKNANLGGTYNYKQEEDALRIKVKPQTAEFRERMTYTFDNTKDNSSEVILHWEKLKVSFKIEVETAKQAMAAIEQSIKDIKKEYRVYMNAASYCSESKTELDKGIEWINKAISLNDYWYAHWIKADILAAKKSYKDAIASAKKSIVLGEKKYKAEEKEFKYKEDLEKEIEKWGSM